jgi:hypothetical protein
VARARKLRHQPSDDQCSQARQQIKRLLEKEFRKLAADHEDIAQDAIFAASRTCREPAAFVALAVTRARGIATKWANKVDREQPAVGATNTEATQLPFVSGKAPRAARPLAKTEREKLAAALAIAQSSTLALMARHPTKLCRALERIVTAVPGAIVPENFQEEMGLFIVRTRAGSPLRGRPPARLDASKKRK